MAGIGFELKRILNRQTFLADMTAYLYAAMVSSGPWLMSIICLAVLGVYHSTKLGGLNHDLFRTTVVYTYAFSLIMVGIVQMIATRYMADRMYEKKTDLILPTLYTCALMVLVAGTAFSVCGYFFCKVTLLHKFLGVLLFLVTSLIWLCMIFLSAIKDYNGIVNAFALGAVISIAAAICLGRPMGTEGYLAGYLLGQWVTLFWIMAKVCVEFPPRMAWNPDFMKYFKQYWDLVGIGFLFNLGIWIDKIMFWLAPDARVIVPLFTTHDIYEGPVFFAYLTIVPAMAIFLLKIETAFYQHYRQYYAKVVGKRSLTDILAEKATMVNALKSSLRDVFVIQGTVSVLCIVFAPWMIKWINLSSVQIPLFQILLIGSFLQVLLLINVIILFYFDLRRQVLIVSIVFVAGNAGLSVLSIWLGLPFYGYGYTYGCLIALMVAFHQLNANVEDLEYLTFALQPVTA
ncbi:exopolysaccharide Pel transporter PelG [Breoghania sp.]|uniref:exopolysaccharide Pel transporter PelG n=1 Tax=Breoghania sp. TaxID=2065378 RepID=UPI0029C7C6EA|nr:exopolysaccharide Pel transporter PelG [Breoghania sp.]